MERIRHVRHTSLRIHSVPLLPPRQSEESQGDSGGQPDPGDLWIAIGWLARDHNRHLTVLTGLPITPSAIVGHQGSNPVLGICPQQPYLLLARSVCPWIPASLKLYLFTAAAPTGEQSLGISVALSLYPAGESLIIH